jgi:hypothetical protein
MSLELGGDLDPLQPRHFRPPLYVDGSGDLISDHHHLGSSRAQPHVVLLSCELICPGAERLRQVLAHRRAMDAEQGIGVICCSGPKPVRGHAANLRSGSMDE